MEANKTMFLRFARKVLLIAASFALVGAIIVLAGCGGGGGGGSSSEESPPAPPFGLNIYEDATCQKLLAKGTLSRNPAGEYVLNFEGEKGQKTSFTAGDIKVKGPRVLLPLGPEGQHEAFAIADFQKGLESLEARQEVRLSSQSSRLTYVLTPQIKTEK